MVRILKEELRYPDYTFSFSIRTHFLYDLYSHFCNIQQSGRYFSQERLHSALSAYQVEDATEVHTIIFLIA